MMVFGLFIILGLLNLVEATTTISRRAGYSIRNPASGLIFQSSLSLVSRALIFMFMPVLGILSDNNNILSNYSSVLIYYLCIPVFLIFAYLLRFKIENIFGNILLNLNDYGTYFKITKNKFLIEKTNSKLKIKKFYSFYFLVLIAYIPYYISWPVIIIMLDKYNESRGFILGLSSVFNGLNTIAISIWIDPMLVKMGMHRNLILRTYSDLLVVRVLSSIIAFLILILVIILLNEI